jgi:simple sugar transport system permease protein
VNAFEIILGTLLSGLRSATPLLQVLLGETVTERSGVANLGVEGQMLLGAFAGFAIAATTGSPWAGLLGGFVAGALLSAVHGALCLWTGANMFASGVAVWMLGGGLSAFFGIPFVGRKIDGFVPPDFGAAAHNPLLGPILRAATPGVLVGLCTWVACGLVLYRTRPGLRLRAVGESGESASTLGIRPSRVRWAAILVGGGLSGLGGASLSVDQVRNWIEWMTAGRGLVAVGLVIVARWNPWWALPSALLFGVVESLALRLQTLGVGISPYLLSTLPYLVCLAVLAWGSVRARARGAMPRDLAQVFSSTE